MQKGNLISCFIIYLLMWLAKWKNLFILVRDWRDLISGRHFKIMLKLDTKISFDFKSDQIEYTHSDFLNRS